MKKKTVKLQEVLDSLDEPLHLANEIVTDTEERAKLGVYFNDILGVMINIDKDKALEAVRAGKEKGMKEKESKFSNIIEFQGEVYKRVNRQARQGDIAMFSEGVNLLHSITIPNAMYEVFEGNWGGLLKAPLYKAEGESWSVYGWEGEEVYVYEKCN